MEISEMRAPAVHGELRTSWKIWCDPGQRRANFVKIIGKATGSELRTSQNISEKFPGEQNEVELPICLRE